MSKIYSLAILLLTTWQCMSQVIITDPTVPYQQDFNSLSSVSLNNSYSTLPLGWVAKEFGSNANLEYRADFGSLAGGDLYSYGDETGTDSLERAMGSIGSGSVTTCHYGVYLVNTSTTTISSITVSYTGELWRVGNAQRSTGEDTLHFFYATNASGIDDVNFIPFSALNFISPAGATDTRNQESVDGNAIGQNTYLQQTLTVSIAPNDTLWLKWFDFNSSSFDDGLAIDDLTITFAVTPVTTSPFGMIALFDTYYTEDFNALGNTHATLYDFSTLPTAWFAAEEGSNAETTYRAAFGDFAGGNTYSFGDSLGTDRAIGSVGSGALYEATYGSAWINTTGQVINNVEITYTGEMWRQGNTQRATGPDTLHFSYAVNASDISTGAYVDYNPLSFFTPVLTGALNVPTNGNSPMYQSVMTSVIGNLSLQPNDTLWVRWKDYNSASFDDGLAIDDFSIAALTTATTLTVEFEDANTYVNENAGIVSIPITIANANNFLTQVQVSVLSSGSVTIGTDVIISPSVVSFPPNSGQTAYFNFQVVNSEPFENDEYFVLQLSNPTNAFLGTIIYDTIHIINYSYPTVDISDLKLVDANGIADSIDPNVAVTGIVHGINYNYTNGIDFYLLDNTGGINVYSSNSSSGYSVQAGDELKIWGKIGQYKGLTRMENIDSIALISAANALYLPSSVNDVSEITESDYIEIDSLILYPQIANWPANLEVQAINLATQDTLSLFISSNSILANQPAPTSSFKMVGLGSQKSENLANVYVDGYRLMAVDAENLSTVSLINLQNTMQLTIYPNPTHGILFLEGDLNYVDIEVTSVTGQVVMKSTVSDKNQVSLDLSVLNDGIYFVQVRKEKELHTFKVIKQ